MSVPGACRWRSTGVLEAVVMAAADRGRERLATPMSDIKVRASVISVSEFSLDTVSASAEGRT